MKNSRSSKEQRPIRYAVMGLGYISQSEVLPAFAHAQNAELAALISDDDTKIAELSKIYGVAKTYRYEDFEQCLKDGIDALYIALPNSMHREYAVRAANLGVHVLCEKPLAMNVEDCKAMIDAASRNKVRLMTAYRLHFDAANLQAMDIVQSQSIGEPRFFQSTFAQQVKDDNVRLDPELTGGCLYDIGIYCINAARMVFQSEPICVFASATSQKGDTRFANVPEMYSVSLEFPNERFASFVCSFGAADQNEYRVLGTRGNVRVKPSYTLSEGLGFEVEVEGKVARQTFAKTDQFAPQLSYFARCILENFEPQPSGQEGMADVRIIEAILKSVETGSQVSLPALHGLHYPRLDQLARVPATPEPPMVHAESPTN